MRRIVCFDFDGVIHSYTSGWQGDSVISDPPVDGIRDVMKQLLELGYEVVIHSARCSSEEGLIAIFKYLEKYKIPYSYLSDTKPIAFCYVDDRALKFTGETKGLVDEINNFHSWVE